MLNFQNIKKLISLHMHFKCATDKKKVKFVKFVSAFNPGHKWIVSMASGRFNFNALSCVWSKSWCLVISESQPDSDLDAFRPLATLMAALRESGRLRLHLVQIPKQSVNKKTHQMPAGTFWGPEDETMQRVVDSSCSYWCRFTSNLEEL